MKRDYVCIVCPNGCSLSAEVEDGKILEISGGLCPKGRAYVESELTNPKRTVATSVHVLGGELPLVSVRVDASIPKADIFRLMDEIRPLRVHAPVRIGQVILRNLWGSGVNVIATKNVPCAREEGKRNENQPSCQ
jgi:CxxC motif-containing protein